jgi:CRP/FNR family transcriptional regulator, cyclic AMP receptor protein
MPATVGTAFGSRLYRAILHRMTEALRRVPLFATLNDTALAELARRSQSRTVEAGDVVAVEGQPAEHVLVVETGVLTATRVTEAGRRLRLGDFAGPCAVDKAAVLDGGGHTATWTASTRVRLRLVPGRLLFELVDDVPAVRRHVLETLARQVRHQAWQRPGDTVTRVAAWRVILPGAQQGLAETLGVTRVTVNRALSTLAGEGLIRTEPGAVTILAPELLTHRTRP